MAFNQYFYLLVASLIVTFDLDRRSEPLYALCRRTSWYDIYQVYSPLVIISQGEMRGEPIRLKTLPFTNYPS